MRLALLACVALIAAGCGTAHVSTATTVAAKARLAPATTATAPEYQVGIDGPLSVSVPGVHVEYGPAERVADDQLVLISAAAPAAARIATLATEHPTTLFVLVDAPAHPPTQGNVEGLVLPEDEAALLAGILAAATVQGEATQTARVGWAGPVERSLLAAFTRGVHDVDGRVQVLHAWSSHVPAACKEAGLSLVDAGASVVVAHGGICAEAVADAAHEQDLPALRLSDFELPSVAATTVVRDAAAGMTHGGENVVFGIATGALGIGTVDPRIPTATVVRARTIAATLVHGATG